MVTISRKKACCPYSYTSRPQKMPINYWNQILLAKKLCDELSKRRGKFQLYCQGLLRIDCMEKYGYHIDLVPQKKATCQWKIKKAMKTRKKYSLAKRESNMKLELEKSQRRNNKQERSIYLQQEPLLNGYEESLVTLSVGNFDIRKWLEAKKAVHSKSHSSTILLITRSTKNSLKFYQSLPPRKQGPLPIMGRYGKENSRAILQVRTRDE